MREKSNLENKRFKSLTTPTKKLNLRTQLLMKTPYIMLSRGHKKMTEPMLSSQKMKMNSKMQAMCRCNSIDRQMFK